MENISLLHDESLEIVINTKFKHGQNNGITTEMSTKNKIMY